MSKPLPLRLPPRVALGALVVGLLGLAGGVAVNQVLARFLAIPDGATMPVYTDAGEAGTPGGEGVVEEGERPTASVESSRRTPRGMSQKQYGEIIVRRNIFDSTAVYVPGTTSSGPGECKSDGNVRLLATVVAEPEEYSSALIAEGAAREAKAHGYAVGDTVGGGRIVSIQQKKVCLDAGDCICMGDDKAKPAALADAGGAPAGEEAGGVTKTGDNQYQVDKSVLDSALGSIETLATQIRAVPHKGPDGEVDGFRLSAIRRGSIFDKLGIKNGDVVHSVNGTPLTSAEGGMSAFNALKSDSRFTFDVTRRNQQQTMEYNVR